MQIIYSLLLSIDGIVYDFVCYLYEIFEFLAKINIFGEENYNSIVNRIYIILGLIMLFALAYSLLKAVINPDSFAKGESSFPKLIQNVVVSLIIIAVLPTVFTVAFNIQNSVLNQDTIPKIILGEEEFSSIENTNPGKSMAYYTFTAFFHENEEWCQNKNNNYNPYDGSTTCSDEIKGNGWVFFQNGDSLTKITKDVLGTEERPQGYSFVNFNQFSEAVHNGQISYMMIVSTVAGIFLAYVLLNFCFNMATRVIKLMYFQLIAPIPVICRVIPGGKLKDVFSDWTKKTLSTFLEVFIHIGVMYLGVFMINVIIANLGSIGFTPVLVNNWALPSAINWGGLGLTQRLIVRALLIMGVVTFIKQAPKLICDMFHLDSGSMKLGLMDKLAMGGGLLAAGAFGGGATAALRNGIGQWRQEKSWKNRGRAVLSGLAGGVSGAVRSGYGAKGAKNIKDMNTAIAKGSTAATTAKAKREAYKASHRGTGMLDTAFNVGIGHVSDALGGIKEYVGFSDGLEGLKTEQAIYQTGMGFKKKMFDLVSDNEGVLAYQGLKQNAQDKDINDYVKSIENRITNSGYKDRDSIGFYKTNAITGAKEYYKENGQIINDFTSRAIEAKKADIKKYDDAIKLASMKAIQEKLEKGDGRFKAVQEEFKVWQTQNANIADVQSLKLLDDLSAGQMTAIEQALGSNSQAAFTQVLDALEGDAQAMAALNIESAGLLANDKAMKKANGRVQEEMAKRIQEQKKDNK